MMTRTTATTLTRFAAAAALTVPIVAGAMLPATAHADNFWQRSASTQANKNTWRNLGYGAAGVAAYGFLSHNTTIGLLGAAGALYPADRYEQERHSQSVQNNGWHGGWSGYRNHGSYYGAGYNRGYSFNSAYSNYGRYNCNGR